MILFFLFFFEPLAQDLEQRAVIFQLFIDFNLQQIVYLCLASWFYKLRWHFFLSSVLCLGDHGDFTTCLYEIQDSKSLSLSHHVVTVINQLVAYIQEVSVNISEDFMEHLYDGALAIEVYGHKQSGDRKNPALWDLGIIQAKTRSLRDR